MKFLSNVNDWYLQEYNPDQWNAVLSGYDKFEIPLSRWYKYAETNAKFKKTAIEHLEKSYVNGDWNSLNNELEELRRSDPNKLKEMVKQISLDVAQMTLRISKRDYFAPIQSEVTNLLERIETHCLELADIYLEKKIRSSTSKTATLRWHGGVGTLCTLFCDIRDAKLENDKIYLSATNNQIVDFIVNNFVDDKGEPFERLSVQTYIYKDDKYVKKNRIDITNLENP